MKKIFLLLLFLIPAIGFADTLTLNPTHDVTVYQQGCTSWSSLRGGSGTAHVSDSATNGNFLYYDVDPTQYCTLARTGFVFDLSTLPATSTVTAVTFTYTGSAKSNGNSCTDADCTAEIVEFTPASYSSFANSDYQSSHWGTTLFATGIAYTGFNTGGINDFYFNTDGINFIQASAGNTIAIGSMWHADFSNTAPALSANQATYLQGYFVGSGNDPVLTITYTMGGGGGGGGSATSTATTTVSALTHSETLLIACIIIYFISFFGWGLIFSPAKAIRY